MLRQTSGPSNGSVNGNLGERMKRAQSLLPAILLTALTLGVFWSLQGAGPESAIRQFHYAVVTGKNQAVLELTQITDDQELNGPALVRLSGFIKNVASVGGRYEIRHVKRETDEAQVEVVYSIPQTTKEMPVIWVLRKQNRQWRIMPYATENLLSQT
jgi:hypothetical protein